MGNPLSEGGAKAAFLCVYTYISGANTEKVTKLLGIPEVIRGSGYDQKVEVVFDLSLIQPAKNTGSEIVACKILEEYLAVLYYG
jgi:hypothetical protein